MKCREAFVVLQIFLSILGSVHADRSSDLLQTIQDQARTLALAAEVNYANTCELVSTCLSSQNCSKLECYPIDHQSSETTCASTGYNEVCNTTGAPCNNTIQANFLKGYIRTPSLSFSAQEREMYLGSTICTQRNLDQNFINVTKTLSRTANINYFYNLFFGAVDGSFRHYPGRESPNRDCGQYDPRLRPWYIGAVSILKDVVVLIDTGTAMQQNVDFLDSTTSLLETTMAMITSFVKTLASGDRVTVLPVNASGSYPGQSRYYQYNVPANQPLDSSTPEFKGLLSYMSGSTFSGTGANGNGAPTNFTDGFLQANSTFSSSSPTNSMKIVILVTNSKGNNIAPNIPHKGDLAAAGAFKSSGSQLFVYDLSPGATYWGTYACLDGEMKSLFSVNPLLFMSSYYSFLASARVAASNNQITPFWHQPHYSASEFGQVITVAYPAISPDGQLIGVAGIDVQIAGLESDPLLKSGVINTLANSPYILISQNPNAGNIDICETAYKSNCSAIAVGSTASLCNPTRGPATDEELTPLICCQNCLGGSSNHLSIVVSVVVGVVVGLLVLAVLVFLRRRLKRRPVGSIRKRLALNDYSYDVLRKATNDFATKNIIGKGAFGVVYKGVLGNELVAVKQLSKPADRAEDFEAEIKILGVTSHSNLVELKGTCFQPTKCFLVYELVVGGDLHGWLWPAEKKSDACESDSEFRTKRFLTWNKRRKIARGVARGLNYLHRGLEPNGAVFHLDIKPRNILVEYNFNPKIADFGTSQLYEPGYTFQAQSVVCGTFGYIAPEVLQGGMKPNSKIDVYSYGVVLLQIVSGRQINDPEVQPFMLQWARTQVEDGHVERVVDQTLSGTVRVECREALMANCKQLINLAMRCLAERPELRPEMNEVLETIDGLRDVLDLETPPTSDDDISGPADHETSTDGELKKLTSRRLRAVSGEREGLYKHLSSESKDEVGSIERNTEIAPSLGSPAEAVKGRDFFGGTQYGYMSLGGLQKKASQPIM